jgi:hypothetical protein
MATSPFRTSPVLGPGLKQTETAYHWDLVNPSVTTPSYALGTVVTGNDGHDYVHVKATPAFAAAARCDVNETTWAATANASGAWVAPVAVAAGAYFQAKRFAI